MIMFAGDLPPAVPLLLAGRATWIPGGHLHLLLWTRGIWPHLQSLAGPLLGQILSHQLPTSGPQETLSCPIP